MAARHAVSALPTFAGEPDKWVRWLSSYNRSTAFCGFSEDENIERLHASFNGTALNLVEGLFMLPSEAIETLKRHFGRPSVMVDTLIEKIRKTPTIKTDRPETFIEFGAAVRNACEYLRVAKLEDHLSNPKLIDELVSRLPGHMQIDWALDCDEY
uniref:Uncharacterized protein n=1 Tax=Anopheles dirus TaxID=7168 RepID=A0A182NMR0_9DIPT